MVTPVITKDGMERDVETAVTLAGELAKQERSQEDDEEDEEDEEQQKHQPLQRIDTDDNILPLSMQ